MNNFNRFRVLGAKPKDEELNSYLEAYFGDRLTDCQRFSVISRTHEDLGKYPATAWFDSFLSFIKTFLIGSPTIAGNSLDESVLDEASSIVSLL